VSAPGLILPPERSLSSAARHRSRLDIGGHIVSYIAFTRSESNLQIAGE